MAAVASDILWEREREAAVLAEALASAAEAGVMVVVEGPPGIGKTRLVELARRRARDDGSLVLSARGSELESTVPFAMVRQLFDPVLLAAEPNARAALFEGAAVRAEPVFAATTAEGRDDDAFAKLHGLFWLLSDLAQRRPVVVLFDDAQWSDEPSLHFLAFLAPRLADVRVALVVGTRPVVAAGSAVLARLRTDPSAVVVRPAPLSERSIAEWAAASLGRPPDDAFTASCAQATGGNPFFLSELLREASERHLAPDASAAASLSRLAPQGVAAMVMLRLAGAPPGARELAEAVAVLDSHATLADATALAGLEPAAARGAADALVRAGILVEGAHLGFVHPVTQTAVADGVGGRLADYPGRAARLLQSRAAPLEEVAAHLVHSPPAGDPEVVEVLRAAASRAMTLGAPGSAVAPLERALLEPPPADREPELLLELGRAAAAAGAPEAAAHLRRAVERAPDAAARAEAAIELGRLAKYGGGAAEALPVLLRCAEEAVEPELRELVEAELICLAEVSESTRRDLRPRLDALEEPAPGATGWLAACTWAELAFRAATEGTSARRAAECGARAIPALDGRTEPPADWIRLVTMTASIWCEAFEQAERLVALAIDDARRRGTAAPLSGAASLRAWLNLRRGRLADAESDAAFALRLADEVHGTDVLVTIARGVRALVKIDRGSTADELRDELASLIGDRPDFLPFHTVIHARGCLRLALGDPAGALEELWEVGRRNDAWAPGPSVVPWREAAALALRDVGDAAGAWELASEQVELMRRFGLTRGLGAGLRTAALVGDGDRVAALSAAVDVLEGGPDPLELARTLVELGSALRHARRPTDARDPLRRGVELALRCGADRLAERGRDELLAAGARPRRVALSGVESLTPSERRVAELAAEGRSNREIAQRLYVTQKTVEGHLSKAFDKLGIRSRVALADALRG